MKCPAMNVAKLNGHIENAFRADHAPSHAPSCVNSLDYFTQTCIENFENF